MTSRPAPDYDLELRIGETEFLAVAGLTFEAEICFGDEDQVVEGLVIVPEGVGWVGDPSSPAWLWCEDRADVPSATRVRLTLCDTQDVWAEDGRSNPVLGLALEGVVVSDRVSKETI